MKKAFLAIFLLVGMAGLSVCFLKGILKSMNELKVNPLFDLDSGTRGLNDSSYSSTKVYSSKTKG